MIGNHPVRRLIVAGRHRARQFARSSDQRLERVRVVIVVDALQHRRDALQPHAGVDRRPGQLTDLDVILLQILHEDEVPDLDEAITVLLRAARRPAPDVIAMIVEDLAARPARPVRAHRPEIVLGRDSDDAAFREPGDLLPEVERLIVGVVDGGRQPVRVQPPFSSQQRPRMGDRLLLEIIAERKIAEHLEEGVVPRRITDIV